MRNDKGFSLIDFMLRRVIISAAVALMTLIGSYAQPPDGACDGEVGNAWGLCNAYCEAMDCDSDPTTASEQACEQVAENFYRVTGEDAMPCEDPPYGPQLGSCPCNFDVEFWTDQAQILQTENVTACDPGTMDPPAGSPTNACFTCNVAMWSFDSTTLLSVTVDLWVSGTFSTEDALFFLATDPSESGACFAEGSVDFEPIYTTIDPSTQEVGELPVTNEEFPVCLSDMTALQDAFLALCLQ